MDKHILGLVLFLFGKEMNSMPEEKVWCGKELERLATQEDTVVNVVMEVIDREQKTISSETGIGSAEGGATASVGESGQEPG